LSGYNVILFKEKEELTKLKKKNSLSDVRNLFQPGE